MQKQICCIFEGKNQFFKIIYGCPILAGGGWGSPKMGQSPILTLYFVFDGFPKIDYIKEMPKRIHKQEITDQPGNKQ